MEEINLPVSLAGKVVAGGAVLAVVLHARLELRAQQVRMLDQQFEELLEAIDPASPHRHERGMVIEPAVEKSKQFLRAAGHLGREGDDGSLAAHIVGGLRGKRLEREAGVIDHVLDQPTEQRADDVVAATLGIEMRIRRQRSLARFAPELEVVQLLVVD